ncbi:MAG: hypothetical protein NTY38_09285 [Acidobacteria bacterium]|nr:hypothetical protein [Acidobacteriota bacterium]
MYATSGWNVTGGSRTVSHVLKVNLQPGDDPLALLGRVLIMGVLQGRAMAKQQPGYSGCSRRQRQKGRSGMMMVSCGSMWACLGLLSITGQALAASSRPDYRFKGKISRQVWENYLSRSITMAELYRSPGNLDDDLRMLRNTGAKLIGRAIYLWGARRESSSRISRRRGVK